MYYSLATCVHDVTWPPFYAYAKYTSISIMHMHNLTYTGTVVDPPGIHETVLEYQQSRQYQCDKRGYINMPIGPVRQLATSKT